MRVNAVGLVFLSAVAAMAQSPGTFTPTGNLNVARQFHTATLLTNGKVLLTGGFSYASGFPTTASAELYDPTAGSFSPAGGMSTPRAFHTATQLPNGKVLIAGGTSGVNQNNNTLASAELYDPSTGIFTSAGSMTAPREQHTATL